MGRGGGGSAAPTDPRLAISAAGNTSGTLTLIGTGTAVFAGGPNITLSQQGSTITISGAAGGAAAGVAAISASNTAYTSGTIVLTGSNAVTVRSTTGNAVVIDAPTQTAQTQNLHNVTLAGNTAGALAHVSSGTMTLAGGNNITLSQAGNAITISGGAETQTAISGVAASNTTYTSGTVTFTGVGGGVTVSSNTGQRIDISVAAPVAQTVQTQNVVVPSGSDTTYTSGTVVFTGSNAVTVRSTTGQAIVIDAPTQTTQTQGILSAGVSTGGNTAGNTTVNTGSRMVLVGMGAATLSQTTGAGASTISISVPTGASATGNLGGIAGSNTTYTSGTITFTGVGGGITVSSNTGQRIDLSVAAQTVQTQGVLSAGVSNVGNTAGNTTVNTGSRMVFAGAGIVTLSQATAAGASTITISATESVQTQGILSAGVSTGGNTIGNTTVNTGSRMVFVGSGNVTLSQGTAAGASTITMSVGTQTVQTQNVVDVTLSGNTSGAMALISSGTMTLAGGNNITLSQNGNAVTISAAAGGGAGFSAGVSNLGNTAGSTGVTGTRLVFVGSDNVTLSQSTDANGGTVSFNAAGGGAGQFSAGVSNLGNTAGSTGITGTRLVLVGSQGVSLSQSTDANGGTVSILPPVLASHSYYDPFVGVERVLGQVGQATLNVMPFTAPNLVHDRVVIPFWITNSTNSTASITLSAWIGLYTKNVSTLSLSVSYSTSAAMTLSGNNNNSLYAGMRLVTLGATSTLTQGDYWAGIVSRTTSAGGNGTISNLMASQMGTNFSGLFGVASNATNQTMPGVGTYTASTSAIPGSIAFSQINGTGSLPMRPPVFYFASGTV